MSERLFALQHDIYGCMNPRCHFIFTINELQSIDTQNYLKNHKYANDPSKIFPFDLKIWEIDEILNIDVVQGWTPAFHFFENGFVCIKRINLFKLFGTPFEPNQNISRHNLKMKKPELEKIFKRLGYKNKKFVIFRTRRYGLCNWDFIYIFSNRCYYNSKKIMRDQITQDLIAREKEMEEIDKKSDY